MRLRTLTLAAAVLSLTPWMGVEAAGGSPAIARRVAGADPLPLALTDDFKIEKVFSLLIDPAVTGASKPSEVSSWLQMETARRYFGAINDFEKRSRDGHSYTVHWRVRPSSKGEVTVRFEYRQQKLGSHVQTQDVVYSKASGSMRTEFAVQGDDYHEDGAVTAWRVVLIEDNRVVGLQQSFLW